jgi:hypothetical protein
MADLELIFSILGERVTAEISHNEKPKTFEKSKKVARRGWRGRKIMMKNDRQCGPLGLAGNIRKDSRKEHIAGCTQGMRVGSD